MADAAFGKHDGQATFAAIVRTLHEAALNQSNQSRVQGLRSFQIAARRRTGFLAVNHLQICRATKTEQWVFCACDFAEQDDGVAVILEPLRRDVFQFFDDADDGNRRRRVNRAGRVLIV